MMSEESVPLPHIPVYEQIIPAEYGTLKDLDIVKQTIEILDDVYPGHYWAVKCEGGILHIKNLSFDSRWGIARRLGEMEYDAMIFRREVVRAAGEYLERAGLARQRWNGDAIKWLDGVPVGFKNRAITVDGGAG